MKRVALAAFSSALGLYAANTFADDAVEVTTTADSGPGSLRAAITFANLDPTLTTITFNIPGPGVHTIVIASKLPTFDGQVLIDGYTQPGSSPNTNGPGLPDNSVHLIQIDGTNCQDQEVFQIHEMSEGSTVRGLVINRCAGHAAVLFANTGGTHTGGGNHIE